MIDRVYKKVDVIGTSSVSLEEAIRNAVTKSSKTIRNMNWFEVIETRGRIEGGDVTQWQVAIQIGFAVED